MMASKHRDKGQVKDKGMSQEGDVSSRHVSPANIVTTATIVNGNSQSQAQVCVIDTAAVSSASSQSLGVPREKKRQVHNESERKRKDRIKYCIQEMGKLIPNMNLMENQKPSTLDTVEKALEYMRELKQTNQKLLSETGGDVHAAEIEKLRKEVIDMTADRDRLAKLIKNSGITAESLTRTWDLQRRANNKGELLSAASSSKSDSPGSSELKSTNGVSSTTDVAGVAAHDDTTKPKSKSKKRNTINVQLEAMRKVQDSQAQQEMITSSVNVPEDGLANMTSQNSVMGLPGNQFMSNQNLMFNPMMIGGSQFMVPAGIMNPGNGVMNSGNGMVNAGNGMVNVQGDMQFGSPMTSNNLMNGDKSSADSAGAGLLQLAMQDAGITPQSSGSGSQVTESLVTSPAPMAENVGEAEVNQATSEASSALQTLASIAASNSQASPNVSSTGGINSSATSDSLNVQTNAAAPSTTQTMNSNIPIMSSSQVTGFSQMIQAGNTLINLPMMAGNQSMPMNVIQNPNLQGQQVQPSHQQIMFVNEQGIPMIANVPIGIDPNNPGFGNKTLQIGDKGQVVNIGQQQQQQMLKDQQNLDQNAINNPGLAFAQQQNNIAALQGQLMGGGVGANALQNLAFQHQQQQQNLLIQQQMGGQLPNGQFLQQMQPQGQIQGQLQGQGQIQTQIPGQGQVPGLVNIGNQQGQGQNLVLPVSQSGNLLTLNTVPSQTNQLPSALLLPNGQVIPVVTNAQNIVSQPGSVPGSQVQTQTRMNTPQFQNQFQQQTQPNIEGLPLPPNQNQVVFSQMQVQGPQSSGMMISNSSSLPPSITTTGASLTTSVIQTSSVQSVMATHVQNSGGQRTSASAPNQTDTTVTNIQAKGSQPSLSADNLGIGSPSLQPTIPVTPGKAAPIVLTLPVNGQNTSVLVDPVTMQVLGQVQPQVPAATSQGPPAPVSASTATNLGQSPLIAETPGKKSKKGSERRICPKPSSTVGEGQEKPKSGKPSKSKKSKSSQKPNAKESAPQPDSLTEGLQIEIPESTTDPETTAQTTEATSSTTDILAKAAESIFSSALNEISPPVGGFYNPANEDNPLHIDTSVGDGEEDGSGSPKKLVVQEPEKQPETQSETDMEVANEMSDDQISSNVVEDKEVAEMNSLTIDLNELENGKGDFEKTLELHMEMQENAQKEEMCSPVMETKKGKKAKKHELSKESDVKMQMSNISPAKASSSGKGNGKKKSRSEKPMEDDDGGLIAEVPDTITFTESELSEVLDQVESLGGSLVESEEIPPAPVKQSNSAPMPDPMLSPQHQPQARTQNQHVPPSQSQQGHQPQVQPQPHPNQISTSQSQVVSPPQLQSLPPAKPQTMPSSQPQLQHLPPSQPIVAPQPTPSKKSKSKRSKAAADTEIEPHSKKRKGSGKEKESLPKTVMAGKGPNKNQMALSVYDFDADNSDQLQTPMTPYHASKAAVLPLLGSGFESEASAIVSDNQPLFGRMPGFEIPPISEPVKAKGKGSKNSKGSAAKEKNDLNMINSELSTGPMSNRTTRSGKASRNTAEKVNSTSVQKTVEKTSPTSTQLYSPEDSGKRLSGEHDVSKSVIKNVEAVSVTNPPVIDTATSLFANFPISSMSSSNYSLEDSSLHQRSSRPSPRDLTVETSPRSTVVSVANSSVSPLQMPNSIRDRNAPSMSPASSNVVSAPKNMSSANSNMSSANSNVSSANSNLMPSTQMDEMSRKQNLRKSNPITGERTHPVTENVSQSVLNSASSASSGNSLPDAFRGSKESLMGGSKDPLISPSSSSSNQCATSNFSSPYSAESLFNVPEKPLSSMKSPPQNVQVTHNNKIVPQSKSDSSNSAKNRSNFFSAENFVPNSHNDVLRNDGFNGPSEKLSGSSETKTPSSASFPRVLNESSSDGFSFGSIGLNLTPITSTNNSYEDLSMPTSTSASTSTSVSSSVSFTLSSTSTTVTTSSSGLGPQGHHPFPFYPMHPAVTQQSTSQFSPSMDMSSRNMQQPPLGMALFGNTVSRGENPNMSRGDNAVMQRGDNVHMPRGDNSQVSRGDNSLMPRDSAQMSRGDSSIISRDNSLLPRDISRESGSMPRNDNSLLSRESAQISRGDNALLSRGDNSQNTVAKPSCSKQVNKLSSSQNQNSISEPFSFSMSANNSSADPNYFVDSQQGKPVPSSMSKTHNQGQGPSDHIRSSQKRPPDIPSSQSRSHPNVSQSDKRGMDRVSQMPNPSQTYFSPPNYTVPKCLNTPPLHHPPLMGNEDNRRNIMNRSPYDMGFPPSSQGYGSLTHNFGSNRFDSSTGPSSFGRDSSGTQPLSHTPPSQSSAVRKSSSQPTVSANKPSKPAPPPQISMSQGPPPSQGPISGPVPVPPQGPPSSRPTPPQPVHRPTTPQVTPPQATPPQQIVQPPRQQQKQTSRPSTAKQKKLKQQGYMEVDSNLSHSIFEPNRSMTPFGFPIQNLSPQARVQPEGPPFLPGNFFGTGPRLPTSNSSMSKNPEIGTPFNPLFPPGRAQNGLGLNFQPGFGMNSMHGNHGNGPQITPHSASVGVTPHMSNFSLSTIFPDMNNPSQNESLNISPIKFPHGNPMLASQPGMDPNSLQHHHQGGSLYHNRSHPPPSVMSINSILGPNHHGFDGRSIGQMNTTMAPPFHGHGHHATFAMPPLNFSMHDH